MGRVGRSSCSSAKRWQRCPSNSLIHHAHLGGAVFLVPCESQVQVTIALAALRHVFQFLPGLPLRPLLRARPHPFPLPHASLPPRPIHTPFAVSITPPHPSAVHPPAR